MPVSYLIACTLFFSSVGHGQGHSDSDLGKWSMMFYYASTAKQVFGQVVSGKFSSFGEDIYVLEGTYTLDKPNCFRKIFAPIFDTVQLACNVSRRHNYHHHDRVTEGNLFVILRFSRFPWNSYLRNSIAIGDGISYASHVPFADREPNDSAGNYNRFLNYLMIEATFAAPSHPNLQFAMRLHHRCTAWGTFPKKISAGSTSVGVGIRYYF